MPPDAIVGHLQLLGRVHAEPRQVGHAPRHGRHHAVLMVLQPRRLADAILGVHQLARLRVLDGSTLELEINQKQSSIIVAIINLQQ